MRTGLRLTGSQLAPVPCSRSIVAWLARRSTLREAASIFLAATSCRLGVATGLVLWCDFEGELKQQPIRYVEMTEIFLVKGVYIVVKGAFILDSRD